MPAPCPLTARERGARRRDVLPDVAVGRGAGQLHPQRRGLVLPRGREPRADELRRPGRRVSLGVVVPVVRLRRLPAAGRFRGGGLARLLVLEGRGARHEGPRRRPAVRLRVRPAGPGVPRAAGRWQGVSRRRVAGGLARRGAVRVPQPHGFDHPDPRGVHPVAGAVHPALARSCRRRHRRFRQGPLGRGPRSLEDLARRAGPRTPARGRDQEAPREGQHQAGTAAEDRRRVRARGRTGRAPRETGRPGGRPCPGARPGACGGQA